ncbi:MerR family transcriptional regulator [Sphaerisporangium rubeum]|uniref:DNA-binding transcriptional MerR regulator n=1 Tax=Sphaerisporangium rubeum TaxID=321317 RepID=A0A7X0IAS2_9ACTN|nr:MerR family transcriptional regulator [Sphaerisporangium rubeum]MBB6471608.1 DNA-binding transcriptional MerR regulator [Sphaerisporangium rubeum]
MYNIGDFARIGRVSVRMLRHYDTLGLLHPARVDPVNGYRYYEAAQLSRLNRLIALKELGLTLQQVGLILTDKVGTEELHGMLRLRRAELAAQVEAGNQRLARVEARLRLIETEGVVSTDIVIKSVPAVRLAELSAVAESYAAEHIGPVIQPLYPELMSRIEAAGLAITGPSVAYYEQTGDGVRVHAGFPVNLDPVKEYDFDIADLPPIERAATTIHHGPMHDVDVTMQQLAKWIEENGYRSTGFAREVYIQYGHGDPADWVTELQEPVTGPA